MLVVAYPNSKILALVKMEVFLWREIETVF